MLEIALFQPDIAPNAGTIARLAACFGLKVRIIEPAGFVSSAAAFRRAGMDYLEHASLCHDPSWEAFREKVAGRRLILLTTRGDIAYCDFAFAEGDVILLGRESAGVPDHVHAAADARLVIPMRPGLRSLNVAVACAMVTGEAMRQLGMFAR